MEVIRFVAFSIESPDLPQIPTFQRVEFDIYGYEFKEVAKGKTLVCHINHIQKGVMRTIGQTICAMVSRAKRNRSVYNREVRRLTALKEASESKYKQTIDGQLATLSETVTMGTFKEIVAASRDFVDFKARVAALK